MKHLKVLGMAMIVGVTAASLASAIPASATVPSSSQAAHVAAPSSQPLPSLRLARPPQPGTGLDARLRAAAPDDTVACYDQQSIMSQENLDWVSAELGYTGSNYAMLRARATTIGPWEKYDLCYDSTGGYWYIVSDANGLYVSAEFGYPGDTYAMLRARSTSVGPWEKFTLTCHVYPFGPQTEYLTIQSQVNGNYVSTELSYTGSNYAMLRASAQSVTPTEEYATNTGQIGC